MKVWYLVANNKHIYAVAFAETPDDAKDKVINRIWLAISEEIKREDFDICKEFNEQTYDGVVTFY